MNTNIFRTSLALGALLSLGVVGIACDDEEIVATPAGTSGTGGTSTGTGGTSGKGGTAGTTTAGTGGTSGTAGSATTGGAGGAKAGAGGATGGTAGAATGGAGGAPACKGIAVGKGKAVGSIPACSQEMFCKYGEAAFGLVVADVVKNAAAAPAADIGTSFMTLPAAKIPNLQENLRVFVINAFGGDATAYPYKGQSMKVAHTGLAITPTQYTNFLTKVIVPALAKNGVPQADISGCFAPPVLDMAFIAQFIGAPDPTGAGGAAGGAGASGAAGAAAGAAGAAAGAGGDAGAAGAAAGASGAAGSN